MVPLRRQRRAIGRLSWPCTTCRARGRGRGSAPVHQWRRMWNPVLWEPWLQRTQAGFFHSRLRFLWPQKIKVMMYCFDDES